jgi:predicted enzyme related to lactoylglutathione lyase
MGERSSHAPGTFSWTDLATSDVDRAKAFYTGLFGWQYDDQPIPGDGVYSMVVTDGKAVCALSAAQPGMPDVWTSYVTVTSADDAAAKARDAGGTVMMEPFDVLDAGRMALIQDPTGAVFAVWEARRSIGAELVNVPGSLTLNQLNTPDPETALAFYADVFGWRHERMAEGDMAYWGIYNGDRVNAGLMLMPAGLGAPPHWLVYFGCENVDTDAGRIVELGGQVMVPPMDVPGGRITVAQDPTGAVFALFSGRFDD